MPGVCPVLGAVALVALALPLAAQDGIGPVQSVKYIGRFDIASNTFFPSDVDPDEAQGDNNPAILYDNAQTNGSYSTGAAGAVAFNHHMDWGTFATTSGLGASISEVRLGIATNLASPNGPPSVRFRIYAGATGLGVQGTVLADYVVSPGFLSTVAGQYQGATFDVTLPAPITVPDGHLGWSYNIDNPLLAPPTSTGILLAGPPNAPGTGANKTAPAVGFGAYDRYLELTNTYVSTIVVTGPPMLSFCFRMKGRELGSPPPGWDNYGSLKGVALTGSGSATPGSVDNVLHVQASTPGASFVLVVGVTQSDVWSPFLGLQFSAFPWLVQLAPIATDPLTGAADLQAPLPLLLVPGMSFDMQCFAQDLDGKYEDWSQGLQVTVQ